MGILLEFSVSECSACECMARLDPKVAACLGLGFVYVNLKTTRSIIAVAGFCWKVFISELSCLFRPSFWCMILMATSAYAEKSWDVLQRTVLSNPSEISCRSSHRLPWGSWIKNEVVDESGCNGEHREGQGEYDLQSDRVDAGDRLLGGEQAWAFGQAQESDQQPDHDRLWTSP
jgi:hypothetical protein